MIDRHLCMAFEWRSPAAGRMRGRFYIGLGNLHWFMKFDCSKAIVRSRTVTEGFGCIMPSDIALEYAQDFATSVAQIAAAVDAWFFREQTAMPNLDRFEDAIYLKGADRVLMYGNSVYQQSFSPRRSPVGRRGEAFLDAGLAAMSIKSDELILGGAESVEVRHVGAANGLVYDQLTHKRPIPSNASGAVILGVTRRLAQLATSDTSNHKSLENQAALFQSFSRDDKELCRLLAMGETSKDIAEALQCSTRTVENRRAKIMLALDLDKPIDIVKVMVRFADRGLIEFEI